MESKIQQQSEKITNFPTIEELAQIMLGMLVGDNQRIKQSTTYLKRYIKYLESVGPLCQIFKDSCDKNLRQLSLILLKKNLLKHYDKLGDQATRELKELMITRFFSENDNNVRNSIGQLIGLIAAVSIDETKFQWVEVLQAISQNTVDTASVQQRRYGMSLLKFVLETSSDYLDNYYGEFHQFFKKTIMDNNSEIRKEAMKCIIYVISNINSMSEQLKSAFKELILPMLQNLQAFMTEQEYDIAYDLFDLFSLLIETRSSLLDGHLNEIIQYCFSNQLLFYPQAPKNLKEIVLSFIQEMTETKRVVFNQNQDLLKLTIQSICMMISLPVTQEQLQEIEQKNYEDLLQDSALSVIQSFSTNFPKKKIFPLLYQSVQDLINSNDPNKMNAGFSILGRITEGCQLKLRRCLPDLMNKILPLGLNHAQTEVRGAALTALCYFADFLKPEILIYHKLILPSLLTNMESTKLNLFRKQLIAIEIFCENMEEPQIIEYLQQIFTSMNNVLQQPQIDEYSKSLAMSAMGACIMTGKKNILPYALDLSLLLQQNISAPYKAESASLWSESCQTLGKLASSVLKGNEELYQKCIPNNLLEHVYSELLNNEDLQIKEAGLALFYNIADTLEKSFVPLMQKLLQLAFDYAQIPSTVLKLPQSQDDDFGLTSDSESDEIRPSDNVVQDTSKLAVKAAGIHLVASMINASPLDFFSLCNGATKVLELIQNNMDFYAENVRLQNVVLMKSVIQGIAKSEFGQDLNKYKKGLPTQRRLKQESEDYISIEFFTQVKHIIEEDESADVVSLMLESLEQLLKEIGPAFIHLNLSDICNLIYKLLKGECKCQQIDLDDDGEQETGGVIMEMLIDLIPQLARVIQGSFIEPFKQFLPLLLKFTTEDKDLDEIHNVIGCIVECFAVQIIQYLFSNQKEPRTIEIGYQQFLKFVFESSKDLYDEGINRNVAYGLGIVSERGPQFIQNQQQNILGHLQYIYQLAVFPETKVNVCSAVCRLLMSMPVSEQIIKQSLPLLMQNLPFDSDKSEIKVAYKFLGFLCEKYQNIFNEYSEKIIQLFIIGLQNSKQYELKDKPLQLIINYLKIISRHANYGKILEVSYQCLNFISQNQILGIQDQIIKNQIISVLQN